MCVSVCVAHTKGIFRIFFFPEVFSSFLLLLFQAFSVTALGTTILYTVYSFIDIQAMLSPPSFCDSLILNMVKTPCESIKPNPPRSYSLSGVLHAEMDFPLPEVLRVCFQLILRQICVFGSVDFSN
jgi:hypothetical protein